jgi:hypothetical protein
LINCENCGAPISADASDSSVTCTHCGHTSKVPQAKSSGGSSSGGGGGGGGGSGVPQIVVVTASAPAPQREVIISRPAPVIVVRRVGYRRSGSLFGAVLTIMICAGVYWYAMRIRNNVAASVNAAEHAGEHPAGGDHGGEKPKGKK